MNDTNDPAQKDLNRRVHELEQLIAQLDNNANFSNLYDGHSMNMDNISFKGAEVADLIGMNELEEADHLAQQQKKHAQKKRGEYEEENTLNFSFNKESSFRADENKSPP